MADIDAIDWLKNSPYRRRDRAGERGTNIHAVIDKMLRGERYDLEAEVSPWVNAAMHFMDDLRPRPERTETSIYDERTLTAGTFDYLGYLDAMPELGLVLADWKTSAGVYADMAVQLVGGYAMGAEYILTDDEVEHEWKPPDTCLIVHFTQDGYALRPVPMDRTLRRAFLGALEIRKWEEDGPPIGDPIQLRLPIEDEGEPPEFPDPRVIDAAAARIKALNADKQMALSGHLVELGIPTKIALMTPESFTQLVGLIALYESGSVGIDPDDTRRGRRRTVKEP